MVGQDEAMALGKLGLSVASEKGLVTVMNRGGFSWSRFLGITRQKQRIDRRVGFPLFSRQAQYAWLGRWLVRLVSGGGSRR
ncbi:MAG: hypothetical protein DLM66_00210 [Candidatus Dormiibacter spiritus]|nr:MAG: hypothetical protein DLM66_00210 [Candidatus Dormibacteraeota bacterium]